jgi:hypothetical protein
LRIPAGADRSALPSHRRPHPRADDVPFTSLTACLRAACVHAYALPFDAPLHAHARCALRATAPTAHECSLPSIVSRRGLRAGLLGPVRCRGECSLMCAASCDAVLRCTVVLRVAPAPRCALVHSATWRDRAFCVTLLQMADTVVQHGTTWCNTVQRCATRYNVVQHGTTWHNICDPASTSRCSKWPTRTATGTSLRKRATTSSAPAPCRRRRWRRYGTSQVGEPRSNSLSPFRPYRVRPPSR